MSQKDEHSKAIEEYSDFVESISDVGGKLHIVTLENQLIVAQFGPGGWILDNENQSGTLNNPEVYEGIESLLMQKSVKFSLMFHSTLFQKLETIAKQQQSSP